MAADVLHQPVIEIQVVQHAQPHAQKLARLEQMADIRARIAAAGRTVAVGVNGAVVVKIFAVVQVQKADRGEQVPVPRVARRHHAVEEIHPALDRLEDVHRRAHPHQVARSVGGHKRLDRLDDPVHLLRALADGQTPDGVAVQIQFGDLLHILDADVPVDAALIDAEQHLPAVERLLLRVQPRHLVAAAVEPAHRPRAGLLDVPPLGDRRRAFVERHRDRGGELGLDAHAALGRHKDARAVHMRGEGDPLLGDVAELRERKDLKPAAVGEDGPVPVEEAVQAAELIDQILARPDVQMVGVGKLHLTADFPQIVGRNAALDGRGGADVHKDRRLDVAVDGVQPSAPRAALGRDAVEGAHTVFLICQNIFRSPASAARGLPAAHAGSSAPWTTRKSGRSAIRCAPARCARPP